MRAINILTTQTAVKRFMRSSNRVLGKTNDWTTLDMPYDQEFIDACEEMQHQLYQMRKDGWNG